MRPLDVGQTLDVSFKLLAARFKELAIVTAVVLLPVTIISIVATKALVNEVQNGISYGRFSGHVLLYQGASSFLSFFATYLAQAACLYVLAAWYLRREDLSAGTALRQAFSSIVSILWVVLLVSLAVAIGVLACVLPGIWLGIAFSVAVPVVVVEGLRGSKALGRSYDLVKGRWWATLGRFAVAALLTFAVAFVIGAIVGVGGGSVGSTRVAAGSGSFGNIVLQGILQYAANIIVLPFWAAVAAVVYFDLRVRKESFDPNRPAPDAGPAQPAPVPPHTPPPAPTGQQPGWGQAPGAGQSTWGQAPGARPQQPPVETLPPGWGRPPEPAAGAGFPPAAQDAPPRQGQSVGPPGGGWAAPSAPAGPPAPPPPPPEPPATPELPSALDSSLGSTLPEPPLDDARPPEPPPAAGDEPSR